MKKICLLFLLSTLCAQAKPQSCFRDVSALVEKRVPKTSCILPEESDYTANLSLINKKHSKKIQLFSIQKSMSSGSVSYTASIGGTSPIYSGDSYSELISSIGTKYQSGRQDVYFDLINFSTTDEQNFKNSCEIRFANIDKDVRVNTINHINADEDFQKGFFLKSGEVSDVQLGQIETQVINHKTYYKSLISYLSRSKRYFLEIFSSSRAAVRDFCEILQKKLFGLSKKSASVADLVSDAKAEMLERNKVSTKDFLIRFKKELSGNMVVKNFLQPKRPISHGSPS